MLYLSLIFFLVHSTSKYFSISIVFDVICSAAMMVGGVSLVTYLAGESLPYTKTMFLLGLLLATVNISLLHTLSTQMNSGNWNLQHYLVKTERDDGRKKEAVGKSHLWKSSNLVPLSNRPVYVFIIFIDDSHQNSDSWQRTSKLYTVECDHCGVHGVDWILHEIL
jgi:hypothetical protein